MIRRKIHFRRRFVGSLAFSLSRTVPGQWAPRKMLPGSPCYFNLLNNPILDFVWFILVMKHDKIHFTFHKMLFNLFLNIALYLDSCYSIKA